MIYALWFGLLAVGALLVAVGFSTQERPLLFVGLTFFFLLGTILLGGTLEYETGLLVNATSTNVTSVTYQSTDYNSGLSHTFGFLMTIISGLSMWIMYVDWRRLKA